MSPHNIQVHLHPDRDARVDSSCASVTEMRRRHWFVLPPAQEFYFRRFHAEYRSLPTFDAACTANENDAFEFIYPSSGARVYIPRDFAERGRVVFEAVHRDSDATLYWHLNERYLGPTQLFHQQAIDIEAGVHWLTLVDSAGRRKMRRFEVLAAEK